MTNDDAMGDAYKRMLDALAELEVAKGELERLKKLTSAGLATEKEVAVAEQRRHKAQMAMNDAETAYDDFSL